MSNKDFPGAPAITLVKERSCPNNIFWLLTFAGSIRHYYKSIPDYRLTFWTPHGTLIFHLTFGF